MKTFPKSAKDAEGLIIRLKPNSGVALINTYGTDSYIIHLSKNKGLIDQVGTPYFIEDANSRKYSWEDLLRVKLKSSVGSNDEKCHGLLVGPFGWNTIINHFEIVETVFTVNCRHTPDVYPEIYTVSIHKTKEGAEQKKKDCDSLPVDPYDHIPHEYFIVEEELLN